MKRVFRLIVQVAWGVWFGGLVMLFVAVQSLFSTFLDRREIAGEGAAGIFNRFNRVQLAAAAVALLFTFAWWLSGRSGIKVAVFALFALAVVIAVYGTAVLTPQLDAMRLAGHTHFPQFKRLHGLSMGLYLGEMLLVLAGGGLMAWGPRGSDV